jgi:hypothetical protein
VGLRPGDLPLIGLGAQGSQQVSRLLKAVLVLRSKTTSTKKCILEVQNSPCMVCTGLHCLCYSTNSKTDSNKEDIASCKCKRTISNKTAKQGRHFAWASRGQLKMVVLSHRGILFPTNHHTPNHRCPFKCWRKINQLPRARHKCPWRHEKMH